MKIIYIPTVLITKMRKEFKIVFIASFFVFFILFISSSNKGAECGVLKDTGEPVSGEPGYSRREHIPYRPAKNFLSNKAATSDSVNVNISQIEVDEFSTIKVYVQVTDKNGDTISGLTAGNFICTEQGQDEPSPTAEAITVEKITGDTTGINVALVIDRSGSMAGSGIVAAKQAAANFVNSMGVNDKACVIAFSDEPAIVQALTNDKGMLTTAIQSIGANGSTSLYDGAYFALEQLSGINGVKAIVVLADGDDNDSWHTNIHVIDYAKTLRIPIYTVGLGSVTPARLQELSDNTGGVYYLSPTADELKAIYQRISQTIHEQYKITYTTHNAIKDEKDRTVSVTVTNDMGSGSGTGIYKSPFVKLWVDIVGRNQIRIGRPTAYSIRYGNAGNEVLPIGFFSVEVPKGFVCVDVREKEKILWDQNTHAGAPIVLVAHSLQPGEVRRLDMTLIATSLIAQNMSKNKELKIAPVLLPILTFVGNAILQSVAEEFVQSFLKSKWEEAKMDPEFGIYEIDIVAAAKDALKDMATDVGATNITIGTWWELLGELLKKNLEKIGKDAAVNKLNILWSAITSGPGWVETVKENIEKNPNLKRSPPSEKEIEPVQSIDPNDKVGPAGIGSQRYIRLLNQEFLYVIYFENLATATAPAESIQITDYLDSSLDWTWFKFAQTSHTANTSFDLAAGKATWTFNSINLPPNVNSPEGEGWVSFTIKPKKDLPSMTKIKNKASIDFEIGYSPDPIDTPEIFNTIIPDIPASYPLGNIDTASPGSVNRIDGHDLYILKKAFGSSPDDSNWNLAADLDGDFDVDGDDLVLLAANFGK